MNSAVQSLARFFFSSRRRHTRFDCDWSSDVCSSDLGGRYVADFLDRGRVKRIIMQADASSRGLPQDFSQWAVRNDQARMVPFDTLGSTHWIQSSPRLERFNGTAAMEIHGQPAPRSEERRVGKECRSRWSPYH